MRATKCSAAVVLIAVAGLVTCSGAEQPQRNGPARLGVAAAVPVDAGAAGVRIELSTCESDRPFFSRAIGFETASLAELGGFEAKPIRLARRHFFAQQSSTIPAGCYRARVQPFGVDGEPLAACSTVRTAPVPIGPAAARHLLLVARCGTAPFDTPQIADQLNFAPMLSALTHRQTTESSVEICARATDPESDALAIVWSARTSAGNPVPLAPAPASRATGEKVGNTLVECVRLELLELPLTVSATAFDGRHQHMRGFVSHEALGVHRHGIAARSRAAKTLRLEADAADDCPPEDRARITDVTYWIRRDGRLLAPTKTLDDLEPNDDLEAELTVAEGCAELSVALSAMRASGSDASSSLYDRDAGTFAGGTHVLGIEVPDDAFEVHIEIDDADRRVLGSTHRQLSPKPLERSGRL